MTRKVSYITLFLLILYSCNPVAKEDKKQPDKGDYWIVDFKSGNYPSKTFKDNKVYCSSIEITSGLPNFLYSFNLETGKVEWRKEVESWASFSPLILDSSIYYCSYLGHIYYLNKEGKTNWKTRVRSGYAGHSLNPINNNLFVSTVSNGVYEYEHATGNVVSHVGSRKLGVTLPAIYDSLICIANLGKGETEITGDQLICLNYFTKDTIWQRGFSTEQGRPYNQIEKLYSDNNRLYFVQGNSTISCLDMSTGSTLWENQIERNHDEKIVFKNNVIFINSTELYAFNKITGEKSTAILDKNILEYEVYTNDSVHYSIECEIGSFKNNAEFDNSCELYIKKQSR